MPEAAAKSSSPKQAQSKPRGPVQAPARGSGAASSYAAIMALHRTAGNKAIEAALNGAEISHFENNASTPSGSGGRPLEAGVRSEMESRFQHDFSAVRIHADEQAAEAAKSIRAKAYTVGGDIVFGQDRFAPWTGEGKRLLAHELAHVVQQSRGKRTGSLNGEADLEAFARTASSHAMWGDAPVRVEGASQIRISRELDDEANQRPAANITPPSHQLPSGITPTSHQLPPAITAATVANDPVAQQKLAAISARHSGDPENVKGAVVEEMLNREVHRRMQTGSDLTQLMPKDIPASKLKVVNARNLSDLQPGEATFVEGDRIKGILLVKNSNGKVSPKKVKLSDGMILMRENDGFRVLTVFEAKAGQRRAPELHLLESGREEPTKDDIAEEKRFKEEEAKKLARRKQRDPKATAGKVIQSELGGQIRKDVERLSPSDEQKFTEILIDEKRVPVRSSPKSTRFVGVVPKDIKVQADKLKNSPGDKVPGQGINFTTMRLASSEKDVEDAAKHIVKVSNAKPSSPGGPAKPKPTRKAQASGKSAAAATTTTKTPKKSSASTGKGTSKAKQQKKAKASPKASTASAAAAAPLADSGVKAPAKRSSAPRPRKATSKGSAVAAVKAKTSEDTETTPRVPRVRPQRRSASSKVTALPTQQQEEGKSSAVATPGKLSPQMRASVPSKKAPQALPLSKPPATHQAQQAPAKPVTATTQASTTPAVTPVSPPPTQITPTNKPTATGGSTSKTAPDTKAPTSPKSHAAPMVPVAVPHQDASAPSTGQQTKPPSTPKTQTPPTAPTKDPGGKKSTLEAHKGASAIMGTNERGVAATAGASAKQSHGRGVSTSQSVDASGKIHSKIEEIPNTSPQRYRVTVSIDLSAGAQVGAEREGRVGGTLSAGASGSLTMSRSHEMSAEQKDAYIKALNAGSGGATDELRVAQMVESGHISEAREFLKRMKSKGFSAEDAKHMAEGDEETISAEGSVDAKAGMSGSKSGGGTKLGAEFGISKSGQLVRTRTLRGGKVYLTIAIRAASTTTLGGSFSEGAAGMGLTHEGGESKGKSVTFVLDPNNPNFDAQSKEVMAADTVDDLSKLASSKPELAGATTTSHGKSSGLTTTASVGIFGASVNQGGEYGEEETKDEQGVTHRYTGAGTLGGSLSVAGKTVHSSSTTDRFTGEVGPDKKGRGETSSTHTETDYGASASKLAKSLKSDAVGTVGGLLTGHTEVLQSKTEVQGKKLTDDSYTRLAELAKDAKSWQQSWHGDISAFVDWEKTRHRVLAANGDRDRIAKALAEFESEGSGRSKTVENAVSDTGIAFDFPDALADQKPVYDELVAADPTDHPRELAEGGKQTEALGEIAADQEKLGHLQDAIRSHQAEITPAALSEMLRRVSARRAELRAEKRELSPAPVAQTKDAPKADSAAAQAPAEKNPDAEAAVKREEAQAKAESIFSDMRANKSREQGNFSEIQKELDKEKSWFSKPDVIRIAYLLNDLKPMYGQWDKSIGDLRNVLMDAGQSPDLANQYGPDRARWQSIHDKVFTW